VAIDQWRADVSRFGLRINYQGVGSSTGRSFYVKNQVDFAVSEIPFEQSDVNDLQSQGRQYVYLPIVAGGTSLMYNLRDTSNNPITTLKLSSATVTAIFTGKITKWSDPAIQSENPGLALPTQGPYAGIVPVTRSDGSGTSAQFSAYMAHMQPQQWCDFAKSQGIGCGSTSSYPDFSGSVQQPGSDGVANYVHSETSGHGAITYVEAAYALQRGRPVAFLRNESGNYTLPTSQNVSIALQKATLNADHTQNLEEVYVNSDPNAYAMSSYSYMIAPTNNFDPAKGNVLGQFMLYFACQGQRKADLLGYSPLPPNLVQIVFDAESHVPGAPAPPPLDQCDNPTIKGGTGSVSNGTAGALSGGHSATGATTATGAPAGIGTNGGGARVTSGASGSGAGRPGAEFTPGAGGVAGGYGSGSRGSPQAMPRIALKGALPSAMPMAGAATVIALIAFGPPLVGNFVGSGRRRTRRG
jgi:phosphate transport system substrate-binding protein